MDNEELLALTPDIDILIQKYENGAKKRIRKAGLKEIENIAMSLHISPLMAAEFMLNSADSASMTHDELFNSYLEQGMELKSTSVRMQTEKEEIDQSKLFDIDCDTVDPDKSWWDPGKLEYGKHPEEKYQKAQGYRLTNPVRLKIESDLLKDVNEFYKEKGQSGSFEECLNCDLSFNIDTVYPAIEFAWEFDKIIQQIKSFIELFKTNMDPTLIFNQLCKIKLFLQKNYMCFANLQNLSLMIPALFAKYSIDLANLSIDWNWFLGGVLKAVFTAIINFLENIRSLVMPFINCYIGAVNTTFGFIKSIVKALNKTLQTVNDAIERGVDSIYKSAMLIGDIFQDTKSDKVKDQLLKAQKEMAKAEHFLKSARHFIAKAEGEKSKLDEKIKFLETKEQDIRDLQVYVKIVEWIVAKEDNYKQNKERFNLTHAEFENAFRDYVLEQADYLTKDQRKTLSGQNAANIIRFLSKEVRSLGRKIKDENKEKQKVQRSKEGYERQAASYIKDIEKRQADIIKAEKNLEKLTNYSLYERYSQRRKDFSTFYKETNSINNLLSNSKGNYKTGWWSGLQDLNPSIAKQYNSDLKSLSEWCSARFGLNIENEYVRNEYWSKGFNDYLNSRENWATKKIEGVRDAMLAPAVNLKSFINDFIGNVVNAVRSLSFLFERGAMLELKLLGEILQLVHLLRLIFLIKKLIDEGISSCDQFNNNKENQAVLKKSVEELNDNLEVSMVEEEDPKFNSEIKMARIFTKNNRNEHLLDFSDCSELAFYMGEKNPNLEDIYSTLKTVLIK